MGKIGGYRFSAMDNQQSTQAIILSRAPRGNENNLLTLLAFYRRIGVTLVTFLVLGLMQTK
jgi:hypothetical protein